MRKSVFIAVLTILLGVAILPARGQLRPVPIVDSTRPEYAKAPSETDPVANQDPSTFYDPANPDSHKLQKSEEALAAMPREKRGAVDWMRAVRDGTITPRADLRGESKMPVLDLDILLKNTKEMPWVRFPHNSHTQWLACANCHDSIFIAKAGANQIDMTRIFRGESCGTCHGRVAFIPTLACERCHSVPHDGGKAWW
jgi:c(7)-type cytochrome triheme protein